MSVRTPSLLGLCTVKRRVTVPTVVNTVSNRMESCDSSSLAPVELVKSWSLRQPNKPATRIRRSRVGRMYFKACKDGGSRHLRDCPGDHCPVNMHGGALLRG